MCAFRTAKLRQTSLCYPSFSAKTLQNVRVVLSESYSCPQSTRLRCCTRAPKLHFFYDHSYLYLLTCQTPKCSLAYLAV